MGRGFYRIYWSLGLLSACGSYEYPDGTSGASSSSASSPSVTLSSAQVTRQSLASLQLECGAYDSYSLGTSSAAPAAGDASWQSCHSGSLSQTLVASPTVYYVWFKSGSQVLATPQTFEANYVGPSGHGEVSFSNSGFQSVTDHGLAVLDNGLIVAANPNSGASGSFAVFSPAGRLLTTLTGGTNDKLASGGVYAVSGGKFLVSSPLADITTKVNAGELTLYSTEYSALNGLTLTTLASFTGENAGDQLGDSLTGHSGMTLFEGQDRVIVACPYCDDNSIGVNNGKIYILQLSDLSEISPVDFTDLKGGASNDRMGEGTNGSTHQGISQLGTSLFAVAQPNYVMSTKSGIVHIFDVLTGTQKQIHDADTYSMEHLGSGGIYEMKNGKFALVSPDATCAGGTGKIMFLNSDGSDSGDSVCNTGSGPTKLGLFAGNSVYSILDPATSILNILTISTQSPATKLSLSTTAALSATIALGATASASVSTMQLSNDLVLLSNTVDATGAGALVIVDPLSGTQTNRSVGTSGDDWGSGGVAESSTYGYCGVASPEYANGSTKGRFDYFRCSGSGIDDVTDVANSTAVNVTASTTTPGDFGAGGVVAHPTQKLFILGNAVSKNLSFVPFD